MKTLTALIAAASLFGCAHEMTGDEHHAAALAAENKAMVERSEYDPKATAFTPEARLPIDPVELEPLREYNPTEGHLAEADRQIKIAQEHERAAANLVATEESACAGVSVAERRSCPLMTPNIAGVKEVKEGVVLSLKPTAPAQRLTSQLQCHLAFAKAKNFEQVPCPLFIKGVEITAGEGGLINIFSKDAKVATQIRYQARRMFGEISPNLSQSSESASDKAASR